MVNWLVRRKSLCPIFAEYINIVLVSDGDTTSIISRYSTCSGICVSALSLQLGTWDDGKEGPGISGQGVCPETSQTQLVHNSRRDSVSS